MDKKIGIYDSGLGGFSLLQEILNDVFVGEVYYFSDYEKLPYGNLSTDQLKERGKLICEGLIENGVDAILLACNTATVNTIDFLRDNFSIPFVGIEPYINALHKEDLLKDKKRIGLIMTPATAKSKRVYWLKDNFDKDDRITMLSSEVLAFAIEEYLRGDEQQLLNIEKEILELKKLDLEGLILGCTHYPLVQDLFTKTLKIPVVDPHKFVIKQLRQILGKESLEKENLDREVKVFYRESTEAAWENLSRERVKKLSCRRHA